MTLPVAFMGVALVGSFAWIIRALVAGGAGHNDEPAPLPERCPCCGLRYGLAPVSYWSICLTCRGVACPTCIGESGLCSDCESFKEGA